MASLAPGMGLSEETVAKMAGQARTATFGNFNSAEYFTKLQKIMSMATTQGLELQSPCVKLARFSSDRCIIVVVCEHWNA